MRKLITVALGALPCSESSGNPGSDLVQVVWESPQFSSTQMSPRMWTALRPSRVPDAGHRSFPMSSFPGDPKQPLPSEPGTGAAVPQDLQLALTPEQELGSAQLASGGPTLPRLPQVKVQMPKHGLKQWFSN